VRAALSPPLGCVRVRADGVTLEQDPEIQPSSAEASAGSLFRQAGADYEYVMWAKRAPV